MLTLLENLPESPDGAEY